MPAGFVTLLVTMFVSTSAWVAQTVALGKLVFDITGRALDLGLLGLVEFAPAAVLAPFTGPLADRVDRRKVVAIGLAAEAVCALVLAWYADTAPTSVLPIFAVVLLCGVARAVVSPAQRAMPADLAARSGALPRLVALNSVSWQSASIVGPIVAGFLYAASVPLPFVVTAAGFFIGAAAILAVPRMEIRRLPEDRRHPFKEATDGLKFVRRNQIVLGAISLDLMAVLFGGAVALLPAIAEKRLGTDAVGLGWLRAATGIGAGLTTLLLARRPLSRQLGHVLFVAVAVFGAFTVVLGLTRNYAVAFVALAVLSSADAFSVFIRGTIVPLATPEDMRGRVLAVENVFIGASNELGAFESGVAAQVLGLSASIVLGGVATIVVVGVWMAIFPVLRTVDRFADVLAAQEHPS